MGLLKRFTTWLVLLTLLSVSGLVNAKVASGVQNFTGDLHQTETAFNTLVRQAKIDFYYDAAPGSPVATKGGTTTLYRAVGPGELADIQKTGQLINRGSAEGKYFTTSAEHASDYAKQAVKAFRDPPYTTVKTQVPTSSLPSSVSVDRGIPAYVLPNKALPGLKPEILNSMPIPRTR